MEIPITIQRAMKVCGVSRRTIYNWIHAGHVRIAYTPSGRLRVYKSSLFHKYPPGMAPSYEPSIIRRRCEHERVLDEALRRERALRKPHDKDENAV